MKPSIMPASRLASLDMLRGIAIAGMVLVNNPGSWQHMFPVLRHAGWTGYGIADLVFPFFLFAVGAAQSFSLAGAAHTGRLELKLFIRILRRTAILFLLGLFLNMLPGLLQAGLYGTPYDMVRLRIMGVLQRIALVYFAAGICIVFLSGRRLLVFTALLLLGYTGVLAVFPGSLSPGNNPALFADRLLLGSDHLYKGGLDPEGLFSSAAALATCLLGFAAGCAVRDAGSPRAGARRLFVAGLLALALGSAWGLWIAVCKDLWNGPYVLVSAGWAALIFAICHVATDFRLLHRIGMPLQLMGRNALFFFVASGITARILLAVRIPKDGRAVHLWAWLHDVLFASWLGPTGLSSFAFAAAYLAVWWMILYLMDRRGWRISV
jgi:predicted acyltransferase